MYNTAVTIRQGTKTDTDVKDPRSSARSTGQAPTRSSQLAPVPPLTPRTAPLWALSSYILIYPPTCPNTDARRRVSMQRCKPCANPHDHCDMPKYLPEELTQYVLDNFSEKSPPHHVTRYDVSTPLQRLEVENITGHQSVRGRSGVIAVMYETH